MKYLLLIVISLVVRLEARAQVEWLTWEEAAARQAKEPRKLLVDVYTDWCGWCKEMDRRTFSDPSVAREIGENFYAVKLNAETPGQLSYRGRSFGLVPGPRPTHALAKELLGGRLGYPTVVFLDEDGAVIQAVPGFHEADEFAKITSYFGRNYYRDVAWDEYVNE